MEPLAKEHCAEIRFILEGIRDGRLEHNQEVFFCGTARCVAGWKWHMDTVKKGLDANRVRDWRDTAWEEMNKGCDPGYSAWEYAQEKWELTDSEAEKLFDCDATLRYQFAVLETLERGERIV